MRFSKRILLPFFLLTLFSVYQVSITMFSHIHFINGVMIVHSHFAKDKNHTHTSAQVLLIDRMSHFQTSDLDGSFECRVARPVLYALDILYSTPCVQGTHLKSLNLRAPPGLY